MFTLLIGFVLGSVAVLCVWGSHSINQSDRDGVDATRERLAYEHRNSRLQRRVDRLARDVEQLEAEIRRLRGDNGS